MSVTSKQYATLAYDAYDKPREVGPGSPSVDIGGTMYKRLEYMDRPSGYQGIIYQRTDTGEIVVAHRGTEFDRQPIQDGLSADGSMVLSRINPQATDAIELTRHAVDLAKRQAQREGHVPEVTVTGHSLGGNLAQITAHHFDLRGETFNPYGAVSLDRRIPEGGERVINHVMAGDAVSAAGRHYGQVRLYATPEEIQVLRHNGYGGAGQVAAPATAAAAHRLLDSHSMHQFLDVDGLGRPDRSVLDDPQALRRGARQAPLIARYRDDVAQARGALTTVARGTPGLALDTYDRFRGQLPAGAPAEREQLAERMRGKPWYEPVSSEAGARLAPPHYDLPFDGERVRIPLKPGARGETTSLQDDVAGYLDRMLEAARTGDRNAFRQLTQEAASGDAGRQLRSEAVTQVNHHEQLAEELARQSAQNEPALQHSLRMHH